MISIDDNAPSDLEAHSSNNLPITIALTSRRAARNDFFTPGTLDDGRTRPQALSSNNYPGDLVRTQIAYARPVLRAAQELEPS